MKPSKLLSDPRLAASRDAFTLAAKYSRLWDQTVARGIKRFGERPQGGHVSGIYSEHFPQRWQTRLRNLARAVTEHSDRAYASKPARVRLATLRQLRAAIHARDGSGFYG
jgi:hypothetical protein